MKSYLIAFFGSVLYNAALFVAAKNKCDGSEPPVEFEYRKYFKMNWDNWLFATLLVPVVVWYLPDFARIANEWMQKTAGFQLSNEVYYLGSGPLSELVIFAVLWIAQRKKSFIAPVHKE